MCYLTNMKLYYGVELIEVLTIERFCHGTKPKEYIDRTCSVTKKLYIDT